MKKQTHCPLCGSKATHIGFNELGCPTQQCPNFLSRATRLARLRKADPKPKPKLKMLKGGKVRKRQTTPPKSPFGRFTPLTDVDLD